MMMMFKRREDLLKEVLRADKNLFEAQTRFAKRIERLYKNFQKEVELFVYDSRRNAGMFNADQRLSITRTYAIIGQLNDILAESGMDDLIPEYRKQFKSVESDALKYFELLGEYANLSGIDRTSLTGYIRFSETTLKNTVDQKLVGPVSEGLFQAIFGGKKKAEVVDDLLARFETLNPKQAQLVVSESLAQYQRTVTVEKADSLGLTVYLYQGPYDEIMSDQCEFMMTYMAHGLEGAFLKDEISVNLHPDLRADPLIAGGHPRCRHRWTPIPMDAAVEMGFRR